MDILDAVITDLKPNPRFEKLSEFCADSSIILYGAGLTGRHILKTLQKYNINPLFIADDTPSKQGTKLDGIDIVSLDYLRSVKKPYALIVTMLNPQMSFQSLKISLNEKGIDNVFSFIELLFLFPDDLLPYFHFGTNEALLQDTNSIRKALHLFSEPLSKEIFIRNLDFRLNLNFERLPVGDKDEYFPSSIIDIPEGAVFFDCGAFDGDTLRSFISRNKNFDIAFAFEPDPENFNKLLNYCSGIESELSKKIYVFNYGISSRHDFLKFNSLNNMASSIAEEGNVVIQTLDLDSLFLPLLKNYSGSIFIKMDIEGEEPKALEGCKRLIKEKQPHLAISSYHNSDDLWNIPLFINSINPAYKFFLRQHGNDSMDLVLYAIAG
jgi:FkbM family methyltransferase